MSNSNTLIQSEAPASTTDIAEEDEVTGYPEGEDEPMPEEGPEAEGYGEHFIPSWDICPIASRTFRIHSMRTICVAAGRLMVSRPLALIPFVLPCFRLSIRC